jgi:hypothetical protein
MPDLQLSFHGTFALKKDDVLKILQAAQESQGLKDTRAGLMERTGLGNEKVLRIKSWAIRCGLVDGNHLTPEGKIILAKDPYLQSPITDWYMHFHLSFGDNGLATPPETPADWGGWTWFVYEFLPQYSSFTLSQIVQNSASIFTQETEKRLTENFRILLRTYILPPNRSELSPLRSTQFLSLTDDQFSTGQSNLPNPYLIGYFLAQLWQRDFGPATSILSTDIFHQPLGLAALLSISAEKLQTCLNQLETHAIIEQRRTVSPAQIIRRWEDPLTLLSKAYGDG